MERYKKEIEELRQRLAEKEVKQAEVPAKGRRLSAKEVSLIDRGRNWWTNGGS